MQYYYDNYMTSRDAEVIIVGDITEEEVLPKLSFLNNLPDKKIAIPTIAATPVVEKTKIYLVDVPKSAQTEFRVGYVTGLKYDATGEYLNRVYELVGATNSRLNMNLRRQGWTYGQGEMNGGKQTGDYEFSSESGERNR
jgi:zinc protease